jgi:hypothetical protein
MSSPIQGFGLNIDGEDNATAAEYADGGGTTLASDDQLDYDRDNSDNTAGMDGGVGKPGIEEDSARKVKENNGGSGHNPLLDNLSSNANRLGGANAFGSAGVKGENADEDNDADDNEEGDVKKEGQQKEKNENNITASTSAVAATLNRTIDCNPIISHNLTRSAGSGGITDTSNGVRRKETLSAMSVDNATNVAQQKQENEGEKRRSDDEGSPENPESGNSGDEESENEEVSGKVTTTTGNSKIQNQITVPKNQQVYKTTQSDSNAELTENSSCIRGGSVESPVHAGLTSTPGNQDECNAMGKSMAMSGNTNSNAESLHSDAETLTTALAPFSGGNTQIADGTNDSTSDKRKNSNTDSEADTTGGTTTAAGLVKNEVRSGCVASGGKVVTLANGGGSVTESGGITILELKMLYIIKSKR